MRRTTSICRFFAGQEICTTVDEYMDYSMHMPTTRAIALFVETIRNALGFRRSIAKARQLEIPVVVCKVGRTEVSARQAFSHTGAIAGDSDTFDALLERYGAVKVDSLEQLLSTATLLSNPRKPSCEGFAMFTDSGGLCGLAGDRGATLGTNFTPLREETNKALKEPMPLSSPNNPLDAMSDDRYESEFMTIDAALEAHSVTDKPMFVLSSYTGFPQNRAMEKCRAADVPFIIGQDNALTAAKNFLSYPRANDGELVTRHQRGTFCRR